MKEKNVLVGNGQYVGVLFVIPVMAYLHGQRFIVYTLVSEIHDNVDMVIEIKTMYEIGVISTRGSCLHLLNRSIPFSPQTDIVLKPSGQMFMKIEMCFRNETSRLAITKLYDAKTGCTNTIMVKFFMEHSVSRHN